MKKLLMIAAVVAATLVSCSKDQVVEIQQEGIKFSVVANNATKSDSVYCANALMNDFYVYAAHITESNGTKTYAPYIYGQKVVKGTNNEYKFATGAYYWPNTSDYTMDFFAIKNADDNLLKDFDMYNEAEHNQDPYVLFTVKEDVTTQKDLVYAVTKGVSKSSVTNNTVSMNFRHALSLIEFNALNQNEHLHIQINSIKVCNVIGGTRSYALYTQSTDGNINTNHSSQPGNYEYYESLRGAWELPEEEELSRTDDLKNYEADIEDVVLPYLESISLTNADNTDKLGEYNDYSMLLIPQTRGKWDPKTYDTPEQAGNMGVYFLVDCSIYNLSGMQEGTVDLSKEVALWNGEAALPVDIDWKEGKRYLYTLIFTPYGNGGFDPTPDDDEDDEPILVPIELDVTVDEFLHVSSEHIGINTEDLIK